MLTTDIPPGSNPAHFYGTPEFERRRGAKMQLPVRRAVEPMEEITREEALRRARAARDRLYPRVAKPVQIAADPTPAATPTAPPLRVIAPSPETPQPSDPDEYGPSTAAFLADRARRRAMLWEITRATVLHFEASLPAILSASRQREHVHPRMVAIYLAKKLTTFSLTQIGRTFSNRDHTTVLHACRKIEKLIAADERVAADIEAIMSRIASSEGRA